MAEETELKQRLIEFDDFIWRECKIETIEQLVSFEKSYQKYRKRFDFVYDSEVDEFTFVDMCDGPMSLLNRGRFQQFAEGFEESKASQALMDKGLTDLEALLVRTFLADVSGFYRLDAYHFGVPPFVKCLCDILNTALSKLPLYTDEVIRKYNEHDKSDFVIGEVFTPDYCLTTSADSTWGDGNESLYHIKPLSSDHTKARAIFQTYDNSEMQVTFLQNASFIITNIFENDGKKKVIWMEECE